MPSIEGSDPATAAGEEAQSWGQVPLQRILIGGPPTTTDDLRDRVEPLLRVPQSGRCLGSLPSRSDTARGMTRRRRLRDWNDARCSTSSTSCRSSLAAAPRSLPGSARSTCWSWAMRVPYRGAFRTQLRATRRPDTAAETGRGPHSERRPYSSPGDVSPKGSRAAGQSLRCTTRVIRCRTRLICQRHRGPTRPGPRPRPASSGAPAHTAVCWLIPLLG